MVIFVTIVSLGFATPGYPRPSSSRIAGANLIARFSSKTFLASSVAFNISKSSGDGDFSGSRCFS